MTRTRADTDVKGLLPKIAANGGGGVRPGREGIGGCACARGCLCLYAPPAATLSRPGAMGESVRAARRRGLSGEGCACARACVASG